jgi:hypothetical protein
MYYALDIAKDYSHILLYPQVTNKPFNQIASFVVFVAATYVIPIVIKNIKFLKNRYFVRTRGGLLECD